MTRWTIYWIAGTALALSRTLAAQDFNGDGFDDLAVGVPGEDLPGIADAGAVNVIYGAPGGLNAAGNAFLWQGIPATGDAAGAGDHFGAVLAHGDFNGDGFDDLAIGVPDEDFLGRIDSGLVHVLYGAPGGLSSLRGPELLFQGSVPLTDAGESGDRQGSALAAGDWNGDGFDDLAVGAPGEDLEPIADAGAVAIYYGAAAGLNANPTGEFWNQDSSDTSVFPPLEVLDQAEIGDQFGLRLAAGDFDGDRFQDLAIGAPHEDFGGVAAGVVNEGGVHVLYGSVLGLPGGLGRNEFWSQDSPQVLDQTESEDYFGGALAAGDFDADGRDDLAVGAPFEDLFTVALQPDTGLVHVFYGDPGGLAGNVARNELWSQDSGLHPDPAEAGDHFGAALLGADVDGNGVHDLVVGAPGEDSTALQLDAGAVTWIPGFAGGLAAIFTYLTQDSPGIPGIAAPFDRWGASLTSGDFGGWGTPDLMIGVPGDNVGIEARAGAVNVYSGRGLPHQLWHQSSPGIFGVARAGEAFGAALSR